MRTFTKLLKTELKLNIRNMNMVIFAIIMPIAVLVVLGFIYQAKPAFIGSWLLAMVSTLSIGMMVGGIAKNEKMASVIASTLYLPMLIFFGATLSFEVMPGVMHKLDSLFPLTQGIQLMKATSLGQLVEHIWIPVVVMMAVTVICTGVAVKYFKWE